MIDLSLPTLQPVFDAAGRKGVVLDIRPLPRWANTPELVAAAVGADLDQIVTPLVFVAPRAGGGRTPIVCLVGGRNQVDTCLMAAVAGEVSLRAATPAETLELTGYSVGRVPPFGHGHRVRTLMDGSLRSHQWVWALAGPAAAVFRVGPRTLMVLANALVVPVAERPYMGLPGAPFEPRHSSLGVGAA